MLRFRMLAICFSNQSRRFVSDKLSMSNTIVSQNLWPGWCIKMFWYESYDCSRYVIWQVISVRSRWGSARPGHDIQTKHYNYSKGLPNVREQVHADACSFLTVHHWLCIVHLTLNIVLIFRVTVPLIQILTADYWK